MVLVGAEVEEVVEDIDRGGGEAEGEEGNRCLQQGSKVCEFVRQENGGKDEQVLEPLLGAHRLGQHAGHRAALGEDAAGGCGVFCLRGRGGVDEDDLVGGIPDGEVGGVVPGISKGWKALVDGFELAGVAHVGVDAAGDGVGKNAEVVGDGVGGAVVRRGGEHQLPPVSVFLPEVAQKLLVVGQGGGIEYDALHDLVLQVRLALGDPSRNAEDARRAAPQKEEQRLVERIQLDECSVKIHAQRDGCVCTHFF